MLGRGPVRDLAACSWERGLSSSKFSSTFRLWLRVGLGTALHADFAKF